MHIIYRQTHGRLKMHTIVAAWKPESKSCYEITLEARKVQWKDTSLSAPVALTVWHLFNLYEHKYSILQNRNDTIFVELNMINFQ